LSKAVESRRMTSLALIVRQGDERLITSFVFVVASRALLTKLQAERRFGVQAMRTIGRLNLIVTDETTNSLCACFLGRDKPTENGLNSGRCGFVAACAIITQGRVEGAKWPRHSKLFSDG